MAVMSGKHRICCRLSAELTIGSKWGRKCLYVCRGRSVGLRCSDE